MEEESLGKKNTWTEVEAHLSQVSARGQEMVISMVQQLSAALIYPDVGNVATNEKLWDVYASEWKPEADWVKTMAKGINVQVLGDEWAPIEDTQRVLDEWLKPLLSIDNVQVAEIGSGGGRIALYMANQDGINTLTLFDVSAKMLNKAKTQLAQIKGAEFVQRCRFIHIDGDADGSTGNPFFAPASSTNNKAYPECTRAAFDLVVCFDVMVHMDLHTMFRCLKRIFSLLKPGGHAFISTSNLLTPDGWDRFRRQRRSTVGGFIFVTPDAVRHLIKRVGLTLVRELDSPDSTNTYYNRDYLAILQRPLC
mmetsp:Transcript_1414/g.1849  ORF Transcript_1414/g.1849 Transcript_1414/m.1849 type:complete len:308 (-) Transcript_1414:645-1568(-)|eukprot:CAMPEP_0197293622 /NCGR_PEP_ID=MMETSP0890-20130614/29363_1 /TAXON_ID=44058 ORGANISM="Aureoumbra lagunensis, Strain CCMP1510" /NCGR_SAMPLE_ID=MMETSP0890 /ASSEMBLY_ACC=CAM_ASM_000533 /LENGTH=307 /DNA_ID=CAMNT_0042768523 /DNA_START=156 /DNA_END=1079 /DNA_ORIENTATION=+